MSFIKNIFGNKKPEAAGDSFIAAVDKAYKKTEKTLEQKAARQRRIEDCAAVLRDCRLTFNKTILFENALANEMRMKGYSTSKQHARVHDCAIGILIVDQALYELRSINSENDMNSAMNKMGMALRQLRRIDNSSAAVSGSTEKIIRQWYPNGLSSEVLAKDLEDPTLPEVPEDIASIIDETFVQNMMLGDSFELCMLKRQQPAKIQFQPDPTQEQRTQVMEAVRTAAPIREPENFDSSSIEQQYSNKF